MIDKIRHGSEITSEKLNEVISVVNETKNEHKTIRELGESITNTVKDVYNMIEKNNELVGEHLDSIPEIKNLYADILLARDSVDWIDLAEDETDANAKIAAALNNYNEASEQPAQRLKVIRGTTSQITLNTPEVKDKQILIAYDPNSNRGIMYFDIGNRRIPVSASGDVNITALVPELEFETLSNGEEVLKIVKSDGSIFYSQDLRGPAGSPGTQGPKGDRGEQGERGEQGLQGIEGTKGQDGATTLLSIWFSDYPTGKNATETYSNHKYMGVKTYLSTDDEATMLSKPIKWFRISGDTLYPIYNQATGYLTFTTTKPAESSFYIKGDQGPQGPQGPAPKIVFRKTDGAEIKDTTLEGETSDGTYIYNADLFKGDKGETGDTGATGAQGPKGDVPSLKFKAIATDDYDATITDTTPTDSQYDAEYTLKIPRGRNGLSITTAGFDLQGNTILIREDGEAINLGQLKGEKGEKGDPATIAIKGAVSSKANLPLTNLSTGDAYVVTSTVDNVSISELYICVDATADTIDTIYKNLGNIKGEKGDTGADGIDGSTWHTGTLITSAGVDIPIDAKFNAGDYYLNKDTCEYFKITTANNSVYTVTKIGSFKGPQGIQGPTGATGAKGRGISKIEKTSTNNTTKVSKLTITYTDNTTSSIDLQEGKDGEKGATGENGTKILKGSGAPSSSSGAVGDFYLDNKTWDLYNKTASGWGTKLVTLKGTNGTNGKDGVRGPQISIFTSTPVDTTEAIVGDIGITTPAFNVYQVRDNGSGSLTWAAITQNGSTVSLIGPKGATGATGATGSYVKATKIPNANQTVSLTMKQSTYYHLTHSNITSISLALESVASGTVGEFICEFRTGSSVPTITLPSGVKYANGWLVSDYLPNKTYIIYILNDLAFVSWSEQ